MRPVVITAIIVVVGSLIFVGGIADFSNQDKISEFRSLSDEELEELSVHWGYNDLLRNPEKYKGKIIEFNGEIFMVDSVGKDHYRFVVWVDDGLDQLVVDWKGGRLLPRDEIRGYAVFEGVIDVGSMLVDDYYNPKPLVKGIRIYCTNC